MKLALRYIPTEVWVDVFRYPWIPRWILGNYMDRFRNRKFVEFLQFYLHEWGKRTLDMIYLDKRTLSEIPRTPMPENIKFFERITISQFDAQTVDFLRRISTLFTDVNLDFNCESMDPKSLRTILDHLAPMLHGINSISFYQWAIPLMEQYFAQKLDQVKMLAIDFDSHKEQVGIEAVINFSLNWLTSGKYAEPKFLQLEVSFDYSGPEIFQQFTKAIQQQFLSAKSACTFVIRFIPGDFQIDDFHLDNDIGERLHGQLDEVGDFQINRNQPNAGKALQEWVGATEDKCYGSSGIDVDYVTFGPIAAENAGANDVDDGAEEEADEPSTSKKPKLTQ